MRKLTTILLAMTLVVGLLPASPAAAQTDDEQIENTSRQLRRTLNRIMPNTRQVPGATQRVFNGALRNPAERCPGVANTAPDWDVGRGRQFFVDGNRILLVQAISYPTVRDARLAIQRWHGQMTNECRNYVAGDLRVRVTNRRRSPAPGVGNQRKAVNLRLTDASSGQISGASVLTAHRFGNVLVYAGVSHIGRPAKPNRADVQLARFAIDYMAERVEALLG